MRDKADLKVMHTDCRRMVALANLLPRGGAEWRGRTKILFVRDATKSSPVASLNRTMKHPFASWAPMPNTGRAAVWCMECRTDVSVDFADMATALRSGQARITVA